MRLYAAAYQHVRCRLWLSVQRGNLVVSFSIVFPKNVDEKRRQGPQRTFLIGRARPARRYARLVRRVAAALKQRKKDKAAAARAAADEEDDDDDEEPVAAGTNLSADADAEDDDESDSKEGEAASASAEAGAAEEKETDAA